MVRLASLFFVALGSQASDATRPEAPTMDTKTKRELSAATVSRGPSIAQTPEVGKVVKSSHSFAEKQALKDCSEVKDGWLFLGGNLSAGNLVVLRDLGITHILNCCDRVPCKFKSSITYQVVSVFDTKGSDITVHFPDALAFIDAAHATGGGVLVHCMVGASRSTSIVLAWLISRCKMPLGEAFRHTRARRSVARPNRAFCLQLIEYEESVLGKRTATLADFGHK